MIAFIDNKDSFTFNIVQSLGRVSGDQVCVFRSEECSVKDMISHEKPSGTGRFPSAEQNSAAAGKTPCFCHAFSITRVSTSTMTVATVHSVHLPYF